VVARGAHPAVVRYDSLTVRHRFVAVLLLLICACASSKQDPNGLQVAVGTLDVQNARPDATTTFTAAVRIGVTNPAHDEVVIDTIEISTTGVGPYNITATRRDFHEAVGAGGEKIFEVFSQVRVSGSTEVLVQNEGSVFIRAQVTYHQGSVSNRKIVVQRVNTTLMSGS
jgi:hypothetical protein